MHFQFEVAPQTPPILSAAPNPVSNEGTVEVLRQILQVQTELLQFHKSTQANQDNLARWRNLLNRWEQEYPNMSETCRTILPALERGYLRLIDDLAQHLQSEDTQGIEDDFSVNEFLDRYGVKIAQLGTILSLVGTLADAGIVTE